MCLIFQPDLTKLPLHSRRMAALRIPTHILKLNGPLHDVRWGLVRMLGIHIWCASVEAIGSPFVAFF